MEPLDRIDLDVLLLQSTQIAPCLHRTRLRLRIQPRPGPNLPGNQAAAHNEKTEQPQINCQDKSPRRSKMVVRHVCVLIYG